MQRFTALWALAAVLASTAAAYELCVDVDGSCTPNVRCMLYNNQSRVAQCANAQEMTPDGASVQCAAAAPGFCRTVIANGASSSASASSSGASSKNSSSYNVVGCFPVADSFGQFEMAHPFGSCDLSMKITSATGVVQQVQRHLDAMSPACQALWNDLSVGLPALQNCSNYVDSVAATCAAASSAQSCAAASAAALKAPVPDCIGGGAAAVATTPGAPPTDSSSSPDSSPPAPEAAPEAAPPSANSRADSVPRGVAAALGALMLLVAV